MALSREEQKIYESFERNKLRKLNEEIENEQKRFHNIVEQAKIDTEKMSKEAEKNSRIPKNFYNDANYNKKNNQYSPDYSKKNMSKTSGFFSILDKRTERASKGNPYSTENIAAAGAFLQNAEMALSNDEKAPPKKSWWGAKKFSEKTEEVRLPLAVAWGKKELDNRLKSRNKALRDIITAELNKPENKHDVKILGENVEKAKKQVSDLQEKLREAMTNMSEKAKNIGEAGVNLAGFGGNVKFTYADQVKADVELLKIAQAHYEEERKRLDNAQLIVSNEAREMALKVDKLREEMRREVDAVYVSARDSYNILRGDIQAELRSALERFGEDEIDHMIKNDYQTIYSGTIANLGNYAETVYGTSSAGAAGANRVLNTLERIAFDLIFSPVTIGTAVFVGLVIITNLSQTSVTDDYTFVLISIIFWFVFIIMESGKN